MRLLLCCVWVSYIKPSVNCQGPMLDLQAIDIIEEVARATGRSVHAVKSMFRWYSPALERFAIAVAERQGIDVSEVRAWYRKSHQGYLNKHTVRKKIESRIAKRQHKKRIIDLLSA